MRERDLHLFPYIIVLMAVGQDTVVCTHCRCTEVRITHRRWYEYPLSLFGFAPFRCMACQRRFFHHYSGQQRY